MAPSILVDAVKDNVGTSTPTSAKKVSGDMVWRPGMYADSTAYTYHLQPGEIKELETALHMFKSHELDGHEVNRANFNLPTLSNELQKLTHDLHFGRGFFLLSGLDLKKYSVEDSVILFLGISSHVGEQRAKQDDDGNMLVHLRHDKDFYPKPGEGPTRHSNKASPFHTDMFTDLLAFQVRGLAARGGGFKVAPSWRVYNELRASRPDLVDTLAAADWHFASRGKLFPSRVRPLLFFHEGRPIFDFSRRPLRGKKKGLTQEPIAEMSEKQLEALEAIEKLAQDNQIYLDMKPGDLVFLNNHALLHSRDSFQDDEQHTRHVVRLWLKNTRLAWKLPTELLEGNKKIFGDSSLPETWAVEDLPKLPVPWYHFTGASH